jgi:hypothetical protein
MRLSHRRKGEHRSLRCERHKSRTIPISSDVGCCCCCSGGGGGGGGGGGCCCATVCRSSGVRCSVLNALSERREQVRGWQPIACNVQPLEGDQLARRHECLDQVGAMRVVWIPGHSATRVAGCRYPILALRVWPWAAAYIHMIYPRSSLLRKRELARRRMI